MIRSSRQIVLENRLAEMMRILSPGDESHFQGLLTVRELDLLRFPRIRHLASPHGTQTSSFTWRNLAKPGQARTHMATWHVHISCEYHVSAVLYASGSSD